MSSQLFVETQRKKQIKEQKAIDKTESGRRRIENIERQVNAGVGYEYNKFRKSGTKIATDDPVAITIEEESRTESKAQSAVINFAKDNEFWNKDFEIAVKGIIEHDNKRYKWEYLLDALELAVHQVASNYESDVDNDYKVK